MYERSQVDGYCASTRVAAGSSGGMQRSRSRVQGCKGHATPKSRGQRAAGARESGHMGLQLSATSSKEPQHHTDVRDRSSMRARWRPAVGEAAYLEGRMSDSAALSLAQPRSSTLAGALSMARTQETYSAQADGQQLRGQTDPPAAGMAEGRKSPKAPGTALVAPSPCLRPLAAAAPMAGPCVRASYLSILADGLRSAAGGGELGRPRRGEARGGEQVWRPGARCLAESGSGAHARGGATSSVAHTRIDLQSTTGRHEHTSA